MDGEETPYQVAIALARGGTSSDGISKALAARGVAPEDITSLLAAVARQHKDEKLAVQNRELTAEEEIAFERHHEARKAKERAVSMNLWIGLGMIAISVLSFLGTGGAIFFYFRGSSLLGFGLLIASYVASRRKLPPLPRQPDPRRS